MKRVTIGVIGIGVLIAGIATIYRGAIMMTQPGGEVSDLGPGPGAIVIALLLLWLGFHSRSPFRGPSKDS